MMARQLLKELYWERLRHLEPSNGITHDGLEIPPKLISYQTLSYLVESRMIIQTSPSMPLVFSLLPYGAEQLGVAYPNSPTKEWWDGGDYKHRKFYPGSGMVNSAIRSLQPCALFEAITYSKEGHRFLLDELEVTFDQPCIVMILADVPPTEGIDGYKAAGHIIASTMMKGLG